MCVCVCVFIFFVKSCFNEQQHPYATSTDLP